MSEKSGKDPKESTSSTGRGLARLDPGQETFVAKVQTDDSPRRGVFTVMGGEETGMVIPIPQANIVTLGRSPDCQIRFDDGNLSRLHAHVMRVGTDYIFSDAKSKNGSCVNDIRISEAVALRDGDRVQLGTTIKLRFALVDEAEEQALRDMYLARRRGSLVANLEKPEQIEDRLDDLMQAREFQHRTLQLNSPPKIPGVDIEILYHPLDLVGGDLYQITTLRNNLLRVFIADATGHGVKASLTTVLIMSEYEFVKHDLNGPAKVLEALNQRIAITFRHLSVHFTAACLDFDLRTGMLRVASAAHPTPYLIRGNQIIELGSGGPFVGLVPDVSYPEWAHPLRRGDYVAAYTDGAIEAFNPAGDSFGEDRLQAAFTEARARNQPLGAHAKMRLEQFAAGRKFDDDLTVLGIGWVG